MLHRNFNQMKIMKRTILAVIIAAASVMLSDAYACCSTASSCAEVSARPEKKFREVVFEVSLHCESCVRKVEENIAFEKGVRDLEVSLENQTVKIVYDQSRTDETKLAEAIEKLGYEVAGKVTEEKGK